MSIRRVALTAIIEVTERGAYANLTLKRQVNSLSAQDAKWVTAAVYETLDHLLYLDYMLKHFIKGSVKPVIRNILRLSACELLFMKTPASAACNEGVKLAKEVGKGSLAGFVNGVLRNLARANEAGQLPPLPQDPLERLSVQYSWPLWIVREWIEKYGAGETEKMLCAPLPAVTLRAQQPFSTKELEEELTVRGIVYAKGHWEPDCIRPASGWNIAADPLFEEGKISIQSESAMLVCRACGIRPGMKVLDMCAAPGGKTAYLWELSKGMADLTAWELHPHRKELLDRTLHRLHVQAHTEVRDAAEFDPACTEKFDLVLLDAPCSGLGVTGKPDVRYQKTDEDLINIAQLQHEILKAAAQYVKPGGTLVYATCTISERENETQIGQFLKEHPQYHLAALDPYLPAGIEGVRTGMVQLFPHRDGTEGFFMARLERCKV